MCTLQYFTSISTVLPSLRNSEKKSYKDNSVVPEGNPDLQRLKQTENDFTYIGNSTVYSEDGSLTLVCTNNF